MKYYCYHPHVGYISGMGSQGSHFSMNTKFKNFFRHLIGYIFILVPHTHTHTQYPDFTLELIQPKNITNVSATIYWSNCVTGPEEMEPTIMSEKIQKIRVLGLHHYA